MLRDGKGQVRPVLLCQRGHGHYHIGDIQPLAVGQHAANLNLGLNPLRTDVQHAQHHLAIIQQQPGLWFQRGKDFGMRQIDAARITRLRIGVQYELRAGFQFDLAAGKFVDAQFWTLQIDEDRGRPRIFLLKPADMLDQLRLVGLLAMAHVNTEGVGTGKKQLFDHLGRIAGRAKRGENTHLAGAWFRIVSSSIRSVTGNRFVSGYSTWESRRKAFP